MTNKKNFLEKNGHVLEISIFYRKDANQRGIYATVIPVKFEQKDGYTVKTFTAYSGYKSLIKPLYRFNRKAWDAIGFDHPVVLRMIDQF